MPRHYRERSAERSLGRREREDNPRYRPRSVTPPGTGRRRDDTREHVPRWEMDRSSRRSRSPQNAKRRGRDSVDRRGDRLHFESPPRPLMSIRNRDVELNYESAQIDERPRPLFDSKYSPPAKYLNERFADRPLQWTEPSRDSSTPVGYQAPPFQNIQGSENATDAPPFPEFNPELSKLGSRGWLDLLESTAAERSWKQDEKLYIMTSRLAGFARQWYLTTGIHCKSWNELKEAFIKAFPAEKDYHALLSKMLARVKEDSESLSAYFLHKVALLNECEIQGVKAVSCIIAGLSSSKMKQQAAMQNCEDPDQLFLYLRSLHEAAPATKSSHPVEDNAKKGRKGKKDCFYCGKSGHVVAGCPLIATHKCTVCNKTGHECEPLSLVPKKQSVQHNQVMEGSLSHTEVQSRNFIDVFISGIVLRAYVDFGSECITIREENALNTRLPIKKAFKVVRGFAGSSQSSIGYIDTSVCIDRAIANVRLMVVPDSVQSIPVVIGQAFTQQPHVVVTMDGGKLRFYDRIENAESKFHF